MEVLRRILGLREAPPHELPLTPEASSTGVKNSVGMAPENHATAPLDTVPLGSESRTRNLNNIAPAFEIQGHNSRFLVGSRSDVGQIRDNNQDSMSIFTSSIISAEDKPDFGLFVVADGMGGHEDGEKASGMTARLVSRYVLQEIYLPMLENNRINSADQAPMTEVLKKAIQSANDQVTTLVPDGGTTVTAVAIMGNLAYVAHVGDSRAYLITQEGIEQLTRDHSLVQRLIELGQLTPEEAAEHPQRNVLYRAIGQNDSLDVDAMTRQLMPANYILICSDGLWNLVSQEELLTITLNHGSNIQLACQTLVDLANERGGSDNITVILVRIPE